MKRKFKYIASFIILVLITTLASPNNLHADSISSLSNYTDVAPRTKVGNMNDFKVLLQKAINNLQPEIKLIVPYYDINLYVNNIEQVNGISKYHVSLTKTGSINTLVISLEYKQAFRLTQALKNTKAYSRLTGNDLALLKVAQSIVNQIISPTMSDYEKELTIHDYIINTTSYDYDRLMSNTLPDSSYTAAGVLINKIAVCEGYSEAAKILLNLVGVECEIVIGKGENNESHAWNIVKLDGEWYMLDTTYNDPIVFDNGKRVETLSYDYFNVTSNTLKKDHSWDINKWPVATGTQYNYFVYNNCVVNSYAEFKAYVIKEITAGSKEITCYINNYNTGYDLSFIFNYYNGQIKYFAPSSTSGSFKIILI